MAQAKRGLNKARGLASLIPAADSTSTLPVIAGSDTQSPRNQTEIPAQGRNDEGAPPSPTKRRTKLSQAAGADMFFESTSPATSTSAKPKDADLPLIAVPGAAFIEVDIFNVAPNPNQPRTVFDDEELDLLGEDIKRNGLIEPIILRLLSDAVGSPNAKYELIAGERRLRAAKRAKLKTLPAIVRDYTDEESTVLALLENMHRADLNAMEEAYAMKQIMDIYGLTQTGLAERLSEKPSSVRNKLRILNLPESVQLSVAAGTISFGTARALLGLPSAKLIEEFAARSIRENLSVRAMEELVAYEISKHEPKLDIPDDEPGAAARKVRIDKGEFDDIAAQLGDTLDTQVRIKMGQKRGQILIDFAGADDLFRIVDVISSL